MSDGEQSPPAAASSVASSPELASVLHRAQQLGMLGDRPIGDVIDHARGFVRALDPVAGDVIDLGAGGGVPGLVIAAARPDLIVTLLDRRRRRTDFLEQMVSRLGWVDRVRVVHEDAGVHARTHHGAYDAATARGFGPPDVTLRIAHDLVRPGGRIVISEPPAAGDRWEQGLLDALALGGPDREISSMVVFHVKHPGSRSTGA